MDEIIDLIQQFQFRNGLWTVLIPIILMGVDIITGLTNAWVKGEIKSSILRKGLAKKIGEMVVLMLGEVFLFGMSLPLAIMDGISIYIILMELISICENLVKLGVPIPNFIKKALADTEEKINGEETSKEETSKEETSKEETHK